jgi:hypothetical protein
MAEPIGAPPGSTLWAATSSVLSADPGAPWTRGALIPVAAGPVYFVYGTAAWVCVR